jgi:hypothetical protein
VDRIDFEEFMLKTVDPAFGPSVRHSDVSKVSVSLNYFSKEN